jgi:TonB family protein
MSENASDQGSKEVLASPLPAPPLKPRQYVIAFDPGSPLTNSVSSQYDRDLVAAISQSWFRLMDSPSRVGGKGKVVVQFELRSNGNVSDVRIASSTMSEPFEAVCQKAVLDPAPFAPWSKEMRRLLTSDTRTVSFTFYSN